jgi:hypothetical protein
MRVEVRGANIVTGYRLLVIRGVSGWYFAIVKMSYPLFPDFCLKHP